MSVSRSAPVCIVAAGRVWRARRGRGELAYLKVDDDRLPRPDRAAGWMVVMVVEHVLHHLHLHAASCTNGSVAAPCRRSCTRMGGSSACLVSRAEVPADVVRVHQLAVGAGEDLGSGIRVQPRYRSSATCRCRCSARATTRSIGSPANSAAHLGCLQRSRAVERAYKTPTKDQRLSLRFARRAFDNTPQAGQPPRSATLSTRLPQLVGT